MPTKERRMPLAFVVLACALSTLALIAAKDRQPSKLVLTSPNGKYTITLDARDDGCGIYVWNARKGVSVYTNAQGPAVAVYSDAGKTPFAIAEGYLQFVDKNGVIRQLTVDEAGKWKTERLTINAKKED